MRGDRLRHSDDGLKGRGGVYPGAAPTGVGVSLAVEGGVSGLAVEEVVTGSGTRAQLDYGQGQPGAGVRAVGALLGPCER